MTHGKEPPGILIGCTNREELEGDKKAIASTRGPIVKWFQELAFFIT